MADDRLLLEDVVSNLILEDDSSHLLLESPTIEEQYFCTRTPIPGVLYLTDPTLGTLDTSDPGIVLTGFQIGHPAERPVVRSKALQNGLRDDSLYVGGRAITISLRLNTLVFPMQEMLDRVRPFMSPEYRPTLVWSLPNSRDDLRSLPVRGIDAPLQIDGPKHPTLITTWLSADARTQTPEDTCVTFGPSSSTESGRTYDETYDKDYPSQLPFGSFIARNNGNAKAHWTATLFAGNGTMINPSLFINGLELSLDQNTGLTLTAGQQLVIDTETKTVKIATTSYYDRVNYLDWNWSDLLLNPGDNLVRLNFTGTSTDGAATICWRSSWY